MKLVLHTGFNCMSCGKDTWNEYYMLYNRVWKKANPKIKGKLCIKCVELKLGRNLTSEDFTKMPVNTVHADRSAILKKRLQNKVA